jgi:hypothetical protein
MRAFFKQMLALLAISTPVLLFAAHARGRPDPIDVPDPAPPDPRPPLPGEAPNFSFVECPVLRLGVDHLNVMALRTAMQFLRYLDPETPITPLYDFVLEDVIRDFQAEMGLLVDGIAGPQTQQALHLRLLAFEGAWMCPGWEA